MALGKSRTLTFAKCEAVVSEILYASGTPRNGRSDCGCLIIVPVLILLLV